MSKRVDDGTSYIATVLFCFGAILFILAYVHGELPAPVQHAVKVLADATRWPR